MNKTELIEAIQQVIIPNNQKAITAESLANLLIEMVNATPEGGSGGSGQVVFYAGTPNENMTEFTLTPEQKAHNAEIVQVIKNSSIALCASFDVTECMRLITEEELDFTDAKSNILCTQTTYMPANIAESQGLSGACVVPSGDFPAFVTEDGSIISFYSL